MLPRAYTELTLRRSAASSPGGGSSGGGGPRHLSAATYRGSKTAIHRGVNVISHERLEELRSHAPRLTNQRDKYIAREESEFQWSTFLLQLLIHITLPASLPFVLCGGGVAQFRNQQFASPTGLISHVFIPAAFFCLVGTELRLGQLIVVYPLQRMVMIFALSSLYFGRWTLIALKYGYFSKVRARACLHV